jgi:hypothetical protein
MPARSQAVPIALALVQHELPAEVVAVGGHAEREREHEREQAQRRRDHRADGRLALVLGGGAADGADPIAGLDAEQREREREQEQQPDRKDVERHGD